MSFSQWLRRNSEHYLMIAAAVRARLPRAAVAGAALDHAVDTG
jgi:hypothetical protein